MLTREPGKEVSLRDGRRLVFDDVGDPSGRIVIYLHGIPDSRWCRHPDDGIAERLGTRLISVDRPGYGDSDPDPDGTLLSLAGDVAQLADHLGAAEYQTLGWSGGGLFALACAARDPSRVVGVGVASALAPVNAALARSTRTENAAASVTARSARTLRSTTISAFFSPSMKRL